MAKKKRPKQPPPPAEKPPSRLDYFISVAFVAPATSVLFYLFSAAMIGFTVFEFVRGTRHGVIGNPLLRILSDVVLVAYMVVAAGHFLAAPGFPDFIFPDLFFMEIRLLLVLAGYGGCGFYVWTKVVLAGFFESWFPISRKAENPNPEFGSQSLVTTGPFQYVRHPIYVSHMVVTTSLAVAACNYALLGLALLLGGLEYLRVDGEEKAMGSTFKKKYVAWKRQTGMLAPNIDFS